MATATTSKILLPLVIAITLGGIGPSLAIADIININPIKDNTLYEYNPADGDHSNALGNHFFAGETAMGELRRGVLAFDIAGSIPAGSTILGVTLRLNMSRTGLDTPQIVELHKLLADWGEGTSAAPGEEGDGAPATTNDATWRHRFFDTIFWTTEGGDFSATVSASQSVGAIGVYMWSSPLMIGDVQSWLNNPATNFGWLVRRRIGYLDCEKVRHSRKRQSACADHPIHAWRTETYANAEAASHPFVSSYTVRFFSSVTLLVTVVRTAASGRVCVANGRLEKTQGTPGDQSQRA